MLIATVVLAIGFIELTRAFSNISSVAVRAVAMSRASNLTNAIMERVMAQDFDARGNEVGGYALQFDGIDDYILLPEVIDIGSTSSTVSMWVKVPAEGEGNLIAEERVGILLGNHDQSPNSSWEIHDDCLLYTSDAADE